MDFRCSWSLVLARSSSTFRFRRVRATPIGFGSRCYGLRPGLFTVLALGMRVSDRIDDMKRKRPNPSVNRDAPVRAFYLAGACGGAPVTLYR